MSLGLLAKDSMADLAACVARAEAASSDETLPIKSAASASSSSAAALASHASKVEDESSSSPDLLVVAVNANPQQAQEDDRASSRLRYGASRAASSQRQGMGPWPPPPPPPTMAGASAAAAAAQYPYAPSQPPSGPSTSSSYYYAGFETAYHGDEYYYHDTYSSVFLAETKREPRGFWDCLFPCWRVPSSEMTEESQPVMGGIEEKVGVAPDNVASGDESEGDSLKSPSGSREDDEVSTNSDVLGERLSDKERQAVLARLRLAQPDASENSGSAGHNAPGDDEHVKTGDGMSSSLFAKTALSQRGLLNGIPAYDTSPLLAHDPLLAPPKKVKGILKRGSFIGKDKGGASSTLPLPHGMPSSASSSSDGKSSQPAQRRSLFPSYETTTRPRKRHDFNVSFAPMARVVTVKSKNDMSPEEKASVWFQKPDYEDFRKTGRIITKAMLEGGSEIWLTSDRSVSSAGQAGAGGSKGGSGGHGGGDGANKENPSRAPGDKWWHKFGHSRRGLEHIVSFDEGRQRQSNVRNAIHAVLEEQARQRRYRKEDPEKLRNVSLHHTSWARDLALAAGASDADAVHSSFAEDRKSREFFLLKMVKTDSATVTASCRIPEFMQPALHSPRLTSPHRPAHNLDQNTSTQIKYRNEQAKQGSGLPSSGVSADGQPLIASSQSASGDEGDSSEVSSEPIRDPNPEDKKETSMAQRAKGFLSDGAGKVDMSAVLSGLGAVESSAAPKASSSSSAAPAHAIAGNAPAAAVATT